MSSSRLTATLRVVRASFEMAIRQNVFDGFILFTILIQPMVIAILAVATITFSTFGLGLLMGCLSLVTRNIMFVNDTVYFLLLLLSGANIPLDQLPDWGRGISWSLPLTRGIVAAREFVAEGSLASVAPLLRGEAATGATYMVVGDTFFRWFEVQAKRRGTLETF